LLTYTFLNLWALFGLVTIPEVFRRVYLRSLKHFKFYFVYKEVSYLRRFFMPRSAAVCVTGKATQEYLWQTVVY